MEIIAYITVNLLLFSSWHVLLFRSRQSLSFADRALGTFVLGLAQIILTEMVLGVLFKKLYATPLFGLNVSISLGVFMFAALRPPGFSRGVFKELKEKIDHFLYVIRSDWILLTVFILFFIYFCYLVFTGYLFPSYSWDALFYHLPTVGFILQSGAIEPVPYNSLIYTFINIFPKNIDLFFLWNIIFLKSDVIVDLSQLIFTLAGMLAVYSSAVKTGIKEKYAVYSSLLFFFAPIIILQSTSNYVDIAVSVLFLVAVNFILYRESFDEGVIPCSGQGKPSVSESGPSVLKGRNAGFLLAGITAGILLGSKGSGPLFVAAISMLYVINELRIRFSLRRKGFSDETPHSAGEYLTGFAFKKIAVRYAACFIAPVILLGSYWYLINWVNYHNPVYPFVVKLFGRTVFPGILTELLHSGPDILHNMPHVKKLFHVWLERTDHYYYASDLSGFGPLWFIVLMPCTVLAVFLSLWKKKADFLLVAVMIIIVFLVHPNNWFTRYVIFLFGLGCLAFGVVIQFFQERGRPLMYLVLLIVLYTFLTVNTPSVTPGKIQEFVNLPAQKRNLANLKPSVLNVTQQENYGLWAWISSYITDGDTLAYNFTPTILATLWNSSFSNKIVYVRAGKFEDWLERLEANNATHVLVLLRPRSIEALWLSRLREMRNNPQWSAVSKRFRLEYYDENHAVFRFFR